MHGILHISCLSLIVSGVWFSIHTYTRALVVQTLFDSTRLHGDASCPLHVLHSTENSASAEVTSAICSTEACSSIWPVSRKCIAISKGQVLAAAEDSDGVLEHAALPQKDKIAICFYCFADSFSLPSLPSSASSDSYLYCDSFMCSFCVR